MQGVLEAAGEQDQVLLHGIQPAARRLLRGSPLLQAKPGAPAPEQAASGGLWFLEGGAEGNAASPASVALLRGLTLLAEARLPADLALLPAEVRTGLPERCARCHYDRHRSQQAVRCGLR